MDKIDNYLTKIKAVRVSKEKVNDLVDTCLLNIRMLYDFLNDYFYVENNSSNAYNNREELINKRERYIKG